MQEGKFQKPLATLTAADARFTEESSRWQSAQSVKAVNVGMRVFHFSL